MWMRSMKFKIIILIKIRANIFIEFIQIPIYMLHQYFIKCLITILSVCI